MRLVYGVHSSFLFHDTGPGHPERPARLEAVDAGVRSGGADLVELEPPLVDRQVLQAVHDVAYIEMLERFCRAGGGALDADTRAVRRSWEAALRAAGAGPAAVEALSSGKGDAAFLALRPPGHHAESAMARGFCLFNNAAVTARMLVDGGERVAIVDWDVHHGNGTQALFNVDERVLYVSLHEFPLYPGTGWVDEIGEGRGAGTVLNLPFPAGTSGDAYRAAIDELILPVISGFSPSWLLISAGYDAHEADPLARLRLLPSDYAVMANRLRATVPTGRTIVFLEGGYDLDALRVSVRATILGLSGAALDDEARRFDSPDRAWMTLSLARERMEQFYDLP